MNRSELLEKLDSLAHAESDAISLYAEAVNCAKGRNPEMVPHLERFLGDHHRHLETIGTTIVRLGGAQPQEIFDPVGRFLHWPTMLHANPCREGALEALAAAEHYHAHAYREALGWKAGEAEVEATLREFAADEERHREFFAQQAALAV